MALLTAALLALPAQAAAPTREEFRYRWKLSNLVGAVAGMFLPSEGDGSLTFETAEGRLRSELLITSPASRKGDYFRYGAEVEAEKLQPIRAWSSYSWRGEQKSRSEEVRDKGVLDIASGIYSIRRDLPKAERAMSIWSDGRIYPVVVIPRGIELRAIGSRRLQARHYAVRGVVKPNEKRWKGKLDLWLATDAEATPIEIVISRNLADVRLVLVSSPPAGSS